MDLAALEKKLVAVARANRPADTVPYTFEKRVLACLAAVRPANAWEELGRGLWRAVAPCAGVMVLLCAWSFFDPLPGGSSGNDLGVEFDRMVLAAADQEQNPDSGW